MGRGQIISMPFIFIFAIIVGAIFLVWGVKTVMDLRSHGSYVQLAKFHEDFEAKVKTYYNLEKDSSTPYKISGLPSDIKYVCFTTIGSSDFSNSTLDGAKKSIDSIDKGLRFELENNRGDNVFYLPLDAYGTTTFKVPHLRSATNPLCVSNGKSAYLANRIDKSAKTAYVEVGFAQKE